MPKYSYKRENEKVGRNVMSIGFTDSQYALLKKVSERLHVPMATLARRATNAWLEGYNHDGQVHANEAGSASSPGAVGAE